jgi:hypothetical protein
MKVLHVIAGIYVHLQIEGFSEDSGRVIVRLSLHSSPVSVNENAFKLVTKEEYDKNSRVLSKYYTVKILGIVKLICVLVIIAVNVHCVDLFPHLQGQASGF